MSTLTDDSLSGIVHSGANPFPSTSINWDTSTLTSTGFELPVKVSDGTPNWKWDNQFDWEKFNKKFKFQGWDDESHEFKFEPQESKKKDTRLTDWLKKKKEN